MSSPPATPGDRVARGPVLAQLFKVFLGLVVGLATADLAVGWYDSAKDLSDSQMLAWDEDLGWTNDPGFENARTRISSIGLRSPEIPADAPPDEVRVLGVGASRTFGAGEDGPNMYETWSHYLEEFARSELPGDWRVLNGGVMGYSLRQSARRAEKLVDVVQPDLILVFVSPGAQLLLDPSAARNVVRLETGQLLPRDLHDTFPTALHSAVATGHGWMLDVSAIYTRYRKKLTDNSKRKDEIDKFVVSRAERAPEVEAMYQDSLAELAALQRIADERGIVLRPIILLEPAQDRRDRWNTYLRLHGDKGAPPIGTSRTESTEVLFEDFAALGVHSWSFDKVITIIGTDRKKYTCDRAHWSDEGHRLVARAILELIQQEQLDESLPAARRANPRTE